MAMPIIIIIIRLQRPERAWVCGACVVSVRRGVAWGVRSQVVGMATSRGARDETGGAHAPGARAPAHALPAHALPAQAMRLTANTKRKP